MLKHTDGPWKIVGESPDAEMIAAADGANAIAGVFHHVP